MRSARVIQHQKTINKFETKHNFFKKIIQNSIKSTKLSKKKKITRFIQPYEESSNFALSSYLGFFPRFSCIARDKKLCFLTAKPRSVFSHFKLARIAFRELVQSVKIQGVQKASW